MTTDEFDRWVESHAATFGEGCHKYLESADAYSAWKSLLGKYEVADATAASRELLAGDLGEWRSFAEHAKLVRRYCLEKMAERSRVSRARPDTFRTAYRCLICSDTGFASVWHSHTVQECFVAKGPPPSRYAASMPCSCELGQTKCLPGKRTFDPVRDCRIVETWDLNEAVLKLVEWCAGWKPPARKEFDEFSSYRGGEAQA